MPLAKHGTCSSCGYEKQYCICETNNQHGTIYPRNTSGETRKFQNYDHYNSNTDDYARTAPMYRDPYGNERKFMEELYPVNDETVSTYLKRTEIASDQLIQSSMHKHIFGGRKPWPSHTSSRYCPVCTLCQFVETLTQILQLLPDTKLKFIVTPPEPNKPFSFTTLELY